MKARAIKIKREYGGEMLAVGVALVAVVAYAWAGATLL